MKLKDKVALVTGAASGIGKVIAETYLREGAKVIIADLREAEAESVAKAMGKNAIGIGMNVASEEEVEKGVEKAISLFGGIDILVSNAGIQYISPLDELPFAEW